MSKARKNVQVGLGAVSILMIFVILCMMVLSVLSFSRAQQNDKTALRERSFQEAYHKADTQAQILYELLVQYNASYTSMNTLVEVPELEERLHRKGTSYEVKDDRLHVYIHVNETQQLKLQFCKSVAGIEKTEWKLVSTGGSSK